MVDLSVKSNRHQNLAFDFTSDRAYLELVGQVNSQSNDRVPRTGPVQWFRVLLDGCRVGPPPGSGASWCVRRQTVCVLRGPRTVVVVEPTKSL